MKSKSTVSRLPALLLCGALLFAVSYNATAAYESNPEVREAKERRIGHYKEQKKFKSSVIGALESVPRDYFMPKNKLEQTYEEVNVPIGYGQTITNMWFVAYMTDLLNVKPGDKVLEIG